MNRKTVVATVVAGVLAVVGFDASQEAGSIAGRAISVSLDANRVESTSTLSGTQVTASAGEVLRTVITDAAGAFRIDGLEPGTYRVEANLAGFRRVVIDNVVVVAGRVTETTLMMRMGILSIIDYVQFPISTQFAEAAVVVHLRIEFPLSTALVGPSRNVLATEHAAIVKGIAKGPSRMAIGDGIYFWQINAGEWFEDGRRFAGARRTYARGEEVIAFLRRAPEGDLRDMGPHLMFPVKNGTVSGVSHPEDGLRDGMDVRSFLGVLRGLDTKVEPPPIQLPRR